MRPRDLAPVPDATQWRTSLLAARHEGACLAHPGPLQGKLVRVGGVCAHVFLWRVKLVARKRSPVQRAGEPSEAAATQLLLPGASARGPLASADHAEEAQAGQGALLERAQAPASPRLAPHSAASTCTRAPPALQACPTFTSCVSERLGVPAGALRGHCPSVPLSLRGWRAAAAGRGLAFPFCDPACCVCVRALRAQVLACRPRSALCSGACLCCAALRSQVCPGPTPGAARQGTRVRVEARHKAAGKPAPFNVQVQTSGSRWARAARTQPAGSMGTVLAIV